MAGEQAKLDKYDELIAALNQFKKDILQSADNMTQYGKECTAAMGSDQLSANAVAKLDGAVRQYHEVVTQATDLQKKLESEKRAIQSLIDASRMED